jgi:hypothetical protein
MFNDFYRNIAKRLCTPQPAIPALPAPASTPSAGETPSAKLEGPKAFSEFTLVMSLINLKINILRKIDFICKVRSNLVLLIVIHFYYTLT